MDEKIIPTTRRPVLFRWITLIGIVLLSLPSLRAQTTNLLNLCTEGALQAAVGIGGIYQFGDCGSNTIPTVQLTEPLVIARDLSLIATQEVLFDGQSLTRLVVVRPGVHLTLRNISFFSGRHTETNFNDGGIPETAGAGIYNDHGIITISDGQFQANSVLGVTGQVGPAGDDGEPGGDAAGGAIYNNGGQITISNVTFIGNSVTAGPGGAGGNGSGFGGNGGKGGDGGSGAGAAIYSKGGIVAIYASTFTTNSAVGAAAGAGGIGNGLLGFPGDAGEAGDGVGAAVSSDGADITISGCFFFGNSADAANGLAGNADTSSHDGERGKNGGDASGGAIFSAGQLHLTNSTFFSNTVISGTGGVGGAGGGSGFGGNGGNGGDGGSATGAAIESTAGQASIINCTVSDNVPTPGVGGAGGQGSGFGEAGKAGNTGFSSGGAVYGRGGEVTLANDILANSTITVGGTVTDAGGNLSTDFNSLLINNTSMRLSNPLLSGPADNGGPTQTMAIATNSPAIDHGVAQFCPSLDQRGRNRVATCDIGAFELTTVANPPLPEIPTNVLNGLTISQSTNLVTLSWPAGYTNLFLQFATNLLSSNIAWALAPQIPTTNSGSNVITINTTNATRPRAFFRLYGVTNLVSTSTGDNGPPAP